jgi:uncharacterized delta-60 repeat protein
LLSFVCLYFEEFYSQKAENRRVRQFAVTLVWLLLAIPHSAFAFLGMNAGATLQGPLPAWTKQIGARTVQDGTLASAVASDPSGNIILAGYTESDLGGNTLTGNRDFFVTKYNSSGTALWTRQLGVVSKTVNANAVATDSAGNIFVAGDTTGGLDGNTLTGYQDSFVTKYDSTGTKIWTKQLGVAPNKTTKPRGVATDASGNIIVAGLTDGGLDGNTLAGSQDFFVTKYDSTGAKQWTKQLGVASNFTNAFAVTTDSSGNIFVAGQTSGGLDGNTKTGSTDFFVTKYDSTGAKIWTKQLGVATKSTSGMAVTTDSSGNIFVAGFTYGGLDGNTLTGASDFFVTKYDSTGTKIWTKQLGVASKNTYGYGVKTDSSGNIFVAGNTTGGLDGNTLTGTKDLFVTKYNSAGTKQWTKQLGVASSDTSGNGVTTDPSDNIFVGGGTFGGLDGNTRTGIQDAFVTKYDSTGAKTWTKQQGALGPNDLEVSAAASDSSGNLYVTGFTDGGLDGNTQAGYTDFFVSKYNSAGVKQWTRQLGATNTDVNSNAIAVDSSGNIFVAGDTDGGLDGNTLMGYQDFFVTKYNSSGTKQWTRELGVASKYTYAYGVVTDSSGNVYVAGNTSGGLDGNTLAGYQDLFITKYNSTGTKVWTRQLGVTSGGVDAYAAAIDSSGNIFVTGDVDKGLDGNTLTGSYDFFVTKYDSTGAKIWTRQLGVASKVTFTNAVATDSFGNVFVTGQTGGGLDGNSLTGTNDLFVTKYTSLGVRQWTKQMGSISKTSQSTGIAMHSSGRLYVVGTTTGGLDFNSMIGAYDSFACQFIGN